MKARTESNSSQLSERSNVFTSAPIAEKPITNHIKNLNHKPLNCNYENEIESSSQAESLGEYTKSGYHPVFLGEKYCNQKYEVIQKLGWGTFSTV